MRRFLICIGLTGIFMAGCAGRPTRVEMRCGTALEAIKTRQIYEPGKKAAMPEGLDGQATTVIMGKYRESFKEPKPPAFTVPVGDIAQ